MKRLRRSTKVNISHYSDQHAGLEIFYTKTTTKILFSAEQNTQDPLLHSVNGQHTDFNIYNKNNNKEFWL